MNMLRISILAIALLGILSNASAQNTGKVSGNISKNQKPAEGATVTLLRGKDSAVVKLSVANKEGSFLFENVPAGKYLISVTAVGHQKSFSKAFALDSEQPEVQLPSISLVAVQKTLADVNVTAKKPLIEQRVDRIIVNVDASILNIGTSALEVLEKSPGITVDRDGNISLKGKEGVLIMVDGRPTHLSGADLTNLLRSMTSNQLDQIEIMANPPARYDAAGNAGIINIKTKKTITAGFNGSASVTYSQGKYPKTAESFNFNFRQNKLNLFANLSHNYQKRYLTLNINRKIYSNTGTLDNIFMQDNTRTMTSNAYNAKVGLDFFASKKTTVGAVLNFNSRPASITNPTITNIFDPSNDLQSVTLAMLNNEMNWNTFNSNLNFRHLLNGKGRELTADIDFVKYGSGNQQFLVNSYTDVSGAPYKKSDTLIGSIPQDLEVYSARVDYVHPLKKGAKFEAGIKSSIATTDNNAAYDSILFGSVVHDFNRSNHFIYRENINAAYVNLNTPLSKKLSAQFGLRLENTISKGVQKTTGESFDRPYTQLFPTAYFQYKADDKNNFGANFGRRVSRPGYQSLNPFTRFIDRYTYQRGNPNLKPSVSNNFELSHSWKNQITTTVNYTYTKDIISEITEQRGQESYNVLQNVSSYYQFGISVNANTPITKWWTSSVNIGAYKDNYKGTISNVHVQTGATGFILNGTEQFKINKSLTAELNGRYRNGGFESFVKVRSVAFVGAGISQKILKNQGTLRLSVKDIFNSQRLKGNAKYSNVDFEIGQVSETRVASIGFTYNFSKGKKIAPVKRTAGSANEEQGRIEQ